MFQALVEAFVLLQFALTMIFGESKPEAELAIATSGEETAIYPLAIPSIASPGAMLAAVVLTDNAQFTVLEQARTARVMLAVIGITYLLMRGAVRIHRWIGNSGASIVSRVMGLILASVAATSVLAGIKSYFEL